jgi:hypothetical protein
MLSTSERSFDVAMNSIECPVCHSVSYSEADIKHKYCGRCHRFHADLFAVLQLPNTQGEIRECWAFVSRDSDGKEGVVGSIVGTLGMQPLMSSSWARIESFMPYAHKIREMSPFEVKLVKFIKYEEVDW